MGQIYKIQEETLTGIADSIRKITGKTEPIKVEDISIEIETELSSPKLPTLENEGTANDLISGKELIDDDGNIVTGTFTLDSELTTQDNLIAQIQTALEGKVSGGATVEPILQTKTVTPSTSAQTVTPDNGYDGLSSVTVNAMATATQATPSISINSSGLITASATQTAGYVSAGTKSATKQLTTQAAKTITPSTSSQTALAKDVYTTGAITVAAIPSTYVKPTTTKAATTYTPTTSNQIISEGTYCSGAQTIKGDANLKAENIAEGVSIFGVTGTHSGGSGSGTIETCTLTIHGQAPLMGNETIWYSDGSATIKSIIIPSDGDSKSISISKNSILCSNVAPIYTGNITLVTSNGIRVYFITGDSTMYYI